MRYALIIFVAFNLAAQVRTNLTPRVQVDLLTANFAAALFASNAMSVAIATNTPKAGRTSPVTVSPEPAGFYRVSATYEFNDFQPATNLFIVLKNKDARLTGRVLIYNQPDEATTLSDWGGADSDVRARITEIKW